MAAIYSEYQSMFASKKLPIYAFRLWCGESVLMQRIDRRNRVNKKQEEQNALRQQRFFDATFSNNAVFKLVDVTHLSEAEVVRKIRDMINEYDKIKV